MQLLKIFTFALTFRCLAFPAIVETFRKEFDLAYKMVVAPTMSFCRLKQICKPGFDIKMLNPACCQDSYPAISRTSRRKLTIW